jgi:hypothetical protein
MYNKADSPAGDKQPTVSFDGAHRSLVFVNASSIPYWVIFLVTCARDPSLRSMETANGAAAILIYSRSDATLVAYRQPKEHYPFHFSRISFF